MWAKLKRFFTNRWVLSVLGLLILSLLIWFAGDAIAVYDRRPLGSPWVRGLLVLLIWLGWAAWEGFKAWRAWRANKRMLAAISGEGGAGDSAAMSQREVAELKQRFDQAMTTLRKARFDDKSGGGGRNYLYQLPWYMFIGAPGSGKTTALINSGLRFPLAETMGKEAVKGIGGTRNCDWWFTDEAVLLDTAGRYTTQSSNRDVDAASWKGFLGLLKKFRPQLPLNGALITLSVSDLFTGSPDERADYARSVRTRVQELYGTLGVRFPLYLVVTKCDLLAGFTEYYNDLGREARAQAWGMTFEYTPQSAGTAAVANFEREFDLLVERLNQRLVTRMEEERDPLKRATLFTFPQQFAGLKGLVKGFLDEVFQSSAFAEEAMLRGVYFTSGTQEGTPFDRVLGNISRNYGLERQVVPPSAGSGRSYFLTRLMREVVFAESDLGGRSAAIERRRARMAIAGYAALGVLAVLLVAGWTVSFVRNKALLGEVDTAAAAIDKQVKALPPAMQGDVRVPLPALNALRDMPTGWAGRDESVPFSLGLGLYQGDKLGVASQQAYLGLLRDAFLPRVAQRLEQMLRSADSPELRYEILKVYVMLYDPKHLKADDVVNLVHADWERNFPREINEADRAALRGHLQTALAQTPLEMVLPVDKTLVEQVRRELASASLAQRAYARLKLLGPTGGVPDFSVIQATGPSGPLVLQRRSGTPLTKNVPAMFTVAGYDKTYRAQSLPVVNELANEEAWVLGPGLANQAPNRAITAQADVQRLYLAEYIKTWDELLKDLQLVPKSDLQSSIQAITVLSAPDSPLKMLLGAVARETTLAGAETRSAEAAGAKALDRAANAISNRIDRLLGDPTKAAPTAADRPEAQVDRYFEPLRRSVQAPPNGSAPIDSMLAVLQEYQAHLRATDDATKRNLPPPPDGMILAKIKGEADRMGAPLNVLVGGLVSATSGQAASGAQAGVQRMVATEVGAFCKQAIEGRYPFARGQAREVPPADFARLFGPNGTFDGFLKNRMAGQYDASGPVWRPVKLADNVDSFPQETLSQFQRASVIRDAFFPSGGPTPQVQADLVLMRVDDGISEVQVSVDGQATRMVPGGGSAIRLNWPSPNPVPSVKMAAMVGGKLESPAGLSFEGAWALFRLADAGRQEGGGSPERMTLSFAFGDKRAVFELRSSSVRNPLRLPELAALRCPA
ncbi:type VI secretion system membrane subunit TssM [Piscinibacter sakaiensis]|uniref:IcmF-related protein n=1 Tax=Piscinibacter sakaiensis TaxID=1547922 RepID=A0A0K8NWW9_PISS1|nr:type VI secretion system membrane subunit TssM [Piscinibacter sakaiensis]GAP34876.1 IcmF-related protein [Piscinibacter sakaiensis]